MSYYMYPCNQLECPVARIFPDRVHFHPPPGYYEYYPPTHTPTPTSSSYSFTPIALAYPAPTQVQIVPSHHVGFSPRHVGDMIYPQYPNPPLSSHPMPQRRQRPLLPSRPLRSVPVSPPEPRPFIPQQQHWHQANRAPPRPTNAVETPELQAMGVLGAIGGRSGPNPYANPGEHHPAILDPTEFPSLTTRNLVQGDSYHQSLPARPYVGMVKQPQSEHTPFTMSSEDFPALPGTAPPPASIDTLGKPTSMPVHNDNDMKSSGIDKNNLKRGILTNPEGRVTNIPASMVNDQFGMVGLLTFIRVAESDPNLVSLALGFDLTALGLNLNATESLYPTFGGPWSEGPVRAEDIDYPVPVEYNISDQLRLGQEFVASIRDKLAPLKTQRYKDELLFYLFYTYTGDALQLLAANELYNRDWRYHKEEKIWLCRAPGVQAIEKGSTYERGTYYFFDPISWRKVAKEFHLEYHLLEDRPNVPPHFLHSYLS